MNLQGCKPPPTIEIERTSTNTTPCSSRRPSPPTSSIPSPSNHRFTIFHDSVPSSLPPLRISNSAPVTPPMSSPTSKPPQHNNLIWESITKHQMSSFNLPNFTISSSAPTSPTRYQRFKPMTIPECDESGCSTIDSCKWLSFENHEPMAMSPNTPTFHLVKPMASTCITNDAILDKGKGLELDFESTLGNFDMNLQGCKPPPTIEIERTSTNTTPCSSRRPSPPTSSIPSPSNHRFTIFHDSVPSSLPPLRISNSAPVTPPMSSPTSKPPQHNNLIWESITKHQMSSFNLPNFTISSSAPTSPTRYQRFKPMTIPECDESGCSTIDSCKWLSFENHEPMAMSPNTPTFHLVKPMASTCITNDAILDKGKGLELDFESTLGSGLKAWEGEEWPGALLFVSDQGKVVLVTGAQWPRSLLDLLLVSPGSMALSPDSHFDNCSVDSPLHMPALKVDHSVDTYSDPCSRILPSKALCFGMPLPP
nr:protein brassinazole-resistant 1-like [Tanacetum cinerariifolium]